MAQEFSPQVGRVDHLTQIGRAEQAHIEASNSAVNIDIQVGAPAAPAAKPRIPRPTLRLPQHPIVGRQKLVDFVLNGLAAGQRDFAFEHLPGVGKTTVACELIRSEPLLARFPDGVLWAHLGPEPDVRRQLHKWAHEMGLSDDDLHDCNEPSDLVTAVADAIGERRMLLVIDDVWASQDCQYFMLGGANCSHVITTRNRMIARELVPNANAICEVRKLDTEDGLSLLSQLAPQAVKLEPQAARRLVERVDGLPIALVLLGNMLRKKGETTQAMAAVMQALFDVKKVFQEKKPWEFAEVANYTLGEVIEASYSALGKGGALTNDSLDGDTLRAALAALSVLRPDPAWFTPELAARVTDAPREALDNLADAGLIEAVRYASSDRKAGDDLRYTMHRLIADYLRNEKLDPEHSKALNLRAAEYYRDQLEALEEQFQKETDTSYSTMYRYENVEWQDCQDNWLYYLACTGYRRAGILAFLRAWFDGFWWWGCFLEFGFCAQLLREWDQRHLPPQAEHGRQLLADFMAAYPKETESRSGGDWTKVRSALLEVREIAGLNDELTALQDDDARHVRAMTDIFLAEAARFGRDDHVEARRLYQEALGLFRQAGESWNVAWLLYHEADMLYSCGLGEDARHLCTEALPIGLQEGDFEVAALLHRLLGDIDGAAGHWNEAVDHYRLAVELSYRFQVEPEDPDPYTIRFYAQVAQVAASRLKAMQARQASLALHAAQALRRRWLRCGAALGHAPDLLDATDDTELASRLFPAPLSLPELKTGGTAYRDLVRAHLQALDEADAPTP